MASSRLVHFVAGDPQLLSAAMLASSSQRRQGEHQKGSLLVGCAKFCLALIIIWFFVVMSITLTLLKVLGEW